MATALAQELHAATEQDSLLVVKTMVLLSLNSIAHIRGLFPESQFTDMDMKTSASARQCVLTPVRQRPRTVLESNHSNCATASAVRSGNQVQEAQGRLPRQQEADSVARQRCSRV